MSLSSKINNPSVIACGTIPYFIHAMSHNLGGNYYEYVVYHPDFSGKTRVARQLIIEIKLIKNLSLPKSNLNDINFTPKIFDERFSSRNRLPRIVSNVKQNNGGLPQFQFSFAVLFREKITNNKMSNIISDTLT